MKAEEMNLKILNAQVGNRICDDNSRRIFMAGIKEAMEWMNKNSNKPLMRSGLFQVIVLNTKLLKQLKEWGIE